MIFWISKKRTQFCRHSRAKLGFTGFLLKFEHNNPVIKSWVVKVTAKNQLCRSRGRYCAEVLPSFEKDMFVRIGIRHGDFYSAHRCCYLRANYEKLCEDRTGDRLCELCACKGFQPNVSVEST